MNRDLFFSRDQPVDIVESVVTMANACLTSLLATAIKATLDGFPLAFNRR